MTKDNSRRHFIKANALVGTGIVIQGGLGSCVSRRSSSYLNSDRGKSSEVIDSISGIEDMKLEKLRDKYQHDLFEHFLPNMEMAVDHEFGGFMLSVDLSTGKQLSTNKRAWWEGRGIWMYSFLYNNIEKNPKYLRIARKSRDFILRHRPTGKNFWIANYARNGSPISGPGDIFGNLYIAEGLVQYSLATKERNDLELAKQILFASLDNYDSADYQLPGNRYVGGRFLNHWMVMLGITTQILQFDSDLAVEQLAERCVDAIIKDHLNPEFKLLNEVLSHDMSRIGGERYNQMVNFGIGVQALWIVLFEAARKKDVILFKKARGLFQRHVSAAHDKVYGGYYWSADNVDNLTFKLDKILSLQEEVLIGSLFLIEHTNDSWAKQCFAETYRYVQEKFVHPGYAFVVENGNRQMDEYSKTGIGIYHHPRHLMFNLLALKRIIKRKGQVSHIFE